LHEFLLLSDLKNSVINLAIIQSFSLLILNVKNAMILFYIFSNNFINHIISNDHDYNDYDEDFGFYYVNFMKSLAQKIDLNTIQFFFQKDYDFPLLQNALKFYNYNDAMMMNTVRNIFLTILKRKLCFDKYLFLSESRANL